MDAQLTFPRIRASEGYLAYFPSQISVLSGLGEKGVRLVVLKQQLKVELTFLMELQNGIEEHRALDRFRALLKSERVSIAGVAAQPISRIRNTQTIKKKEAHLCPLQLGSSQLNQQLFYLMPLFGILLLMWTPAIQKPKLYNARNLFVFVHMAGFLS